MKIVAAHERPGLANCYVAPRNDLEHALALIWEEALGIRPIGLYDNFFDLGGDSLLAVRLISQVRERIGSPLSLAAFLVEATLEHMAQIIEESSGTRQN
jgi:acyl carrier protein